MIPTVTLTGPSGQPKMTQEEIYAAREKLKAEVDSIKHKLLIIRTEMSQCKTCDDHFFTLQRNCNRLECALVLFQSSIKYPQMLLTQRRAPV